jgi:hypothetical protein
VLSFFRTNQLYYSILLIFYILLLRFAVFSAPFEWLPSGHGVLSEAVYGWIGSQRVLSQLTAMVFLLVQGFVVNLIAAENRLAVEVNQFPGLFYVLVSCLIPDFLYLSPVLLGNTFFLVALYEMFRTYKVASCVDRIFNAGFWTGVAGMFYLPFLGFLLLLLVALVILRTLNLQEILIILTGGFLPFFFGWTYCFIAGDTSYFLETQFWRNLGFLEYNIPLDSWDRYLKLGVFLLLIVLVLFSSGNYLYRKNIQVQKKISILYWTLIATAISIPFQENITFEHFLMLAPALGIFLAFSFSRLSRQWAESIHFLVVLLVLALQFVPWLL